jgi:hypothetical protein
MNIHHDSDEDLHMLPLEFVHRPCKLGRFVEAWVRDNTYYLVDSSLYFANVPSSRPYHFSAIALTNVLMNSSPISLTLGDLGFFEGEGD